MDASRAAREARSNRLTKVHRFVMQSTSRFAFGAAVGGKIFVARARVTLDAAFLRSIRFCQRTIDSRARTKTRSVFSKGFSLSRGGGRIVRRCSAARASNDNESIAILTFRFVVNRRLARERAVGPKTRERANDRGIANQCAFRRREPREIWVALRRCYTSYLLGFRRLSPRGN